MLKFSLDLKKMPVQIGDGDEAPVYTLNEMTQKERDSHSDKLEPRIVRNDKNEAVGVKTVTGMKSDLLSICLRDAGGNLVPPATIDSWPTKVVEALFKEAQTMNGMVKEETVEAKKA